MARLLMLLALLPWPAAAVEINSVDDLVRWMTRLGPRDAGEASLTGTLAGRPLTATVQVEAERRAAALELSAVEIGPLSFSGQLEVRRRPRRVVEIDLRVRAVTLGGLPLGEGRASLRQDRDGWSGDLSLDGGAARITGSLPGDPEEADLEVAIAGLDLARVAAAWLPDTWLSALAGQAELRLILREASFTAEAEAAVRIGPLDAGRWELSAVQSEALTLDARAMGPLAERLRGWVRLPATLDLESGALSWTGGPLAGAADVLGLDLTALTQAWPILALAGRLDGGVTIGGREAQPRFELGLVGADLTWHGDAVGSLGLTLQLAEGVARGGLTWTGAEVRHVTLEGAVPLRLDLRAPDLTWLDRAPLDLTLTAVGLTPAVLRPLWHAHPAARFELGGTLTARGTLDALTLGGSLRGTLADADRAPLPLVGTLEGDARAQRISLAIGAVLDTGIRLEAPLVALRRGATRWADVALSGRLGAAMPLALLGPYLPDSLFDPRGRAEGEARVGGTLGAPDLQGGFTLEGGAVTFVDLNQRLHDLSARATLKGTTLEISDIMASSGGGASMGQAAIRLIPTPPGTPREAPLWSAWTLDADLRLALRRFPFIHDSLPNGTFDTDVDLKAKARAGETMLRLGLSGGSVRLTAVRMPAALAVPHHRGVRSLDWLGRLRPDPSVFAGEGRLVVGVYLEDPISVEGPGTALTLSGRVVLERQDHDARTDGGFVATGGGGFQLFDNPFAVTSGRLWLPGGDLRVREEPEEAGHATLRDPDRPLEAVPLEPVLDFTATGRVAGTVVRVTVRGPERRPQLILESTPPLPEYRILTLLITGRVDAVDDRNGDVRRQVAKLVSRFHNPSLARQLYDRLGVDKLGLGFGAGVTSPILTVGKQINRQLYVETVYHHNSPPDENEKEAHVEYRLDPRWTLDTTYGDAGEGGVGVFWQYDFGGPDGPAPEETR